MIRRAVWAVLLVTASAASAHDVSLDVQGSTITKSENNPRSGSFGVAAAGSYDFNDTWSLFGGLTYTRDLATKTADTSSPGSNIFLITVGTQFIPSDHLMFMAYANVSPAVAQQNANTVSIGQQLGFKNQNINMRVNSLTTSGGVNVMGSYTTGGFATSHTVDLLIGVTGYNAEQQLEVPNSAAGNRWRVFCAQPSAAGKNYCPLVNGVSTFLMQARIGAAYTLTLNRKLDLALEGAGYVYSEDPNSVGYFSVLAVGRLPDLGSGVPVAPYLFTGKISALYRFEKLGLRLLYQYAHYTSSYGANHLVSARVSYKFTPSFKLTLTLAGQGDVTASGLTNLGVMGTVGSLVTF